MWGASSVSRSTYDSLRTLPMKVRRKLVLHCFPPSLPWIALAQWLDLSKPSLRLHKLFRWSLFLIHQSESSFTFFSRHCSRTAEVLFTSHCMRLMLPSGFTCHEVVVDLHGGRGVTIWRWSIHTVFSGWIQTISNWRYLATRFKSCVIRIDGWHVILLLRDGPIASARTSVYMLASHA